MTRDELAALHAALSTVLTWPKPVLEQIAAWLAPEAAQKPGNGLDHDPAPIASTSRPAKARPIASLGPLSNPERRLLATARDHPGARGNELAKLAGASRSSTSERLKRLAARGKIENGDDGKWRVKGEKGSSGLEAPRPIAAGEPAGPPRPSPS